MVRRQAAPHRHRASVPAAPAPAPAAAFLGGNDAHPPPLPCNKQIHRGNGQPGPKGKPPPKRAGRIGSEPAETPAELGGLRGIPRPPRRAVPSRRDSRASGAGRIGATLLVVRWCAWARRADLLRRRDEPACCYGGGTLAQRQWRAHLRPPLFPCHCRAPQQKIGRTCMRDARAPNGRHDR